MSVQCPDCEGTGEVPQAAGWLTVPPDPPVRVGPVTARCGACNGTGQVTAG